MWLKASPQLVVSTVVLLIGTGLSRVGGGVLHAGVSEKIIGVVGLILFIAAANTLLRSATATFAKVISPRHLNAGRAASIRFMLHVIGYIVIGVTTLDLLGIPVGKLLLGGAAVGIILGVAAQQALANFFASIVIIISRTFTVGEWLTLTAGALGGAHEGRIKDIGLTHTKLEKEDGVIVLLPNATLLGSAAITTDKRAQEAHR